MWVEYAAPMGLGASGVVVLQRCRASGAGGRLGVCGGPRSGWLRFVEGERVEGLVGGTLAGFFRKAFPISCL